MRRAILTCLAISLFAAAPHCALAADSLFSNVPIQSVFVKPGSPAPAGPLPPEMRREAPAQPNPPPVAGNSLAAVVRAAGFEPREVSAQMVQTKVPLDKFSFPALISASEDKDEVVLVLLLSVVNDESQLPSGKLLELLNASREHAPASFAYSSKRKRIELYRTLDSRTPSAEQLRKELTRLAEIARSTHSLWNLTAQSPAAEESPASGSTTPSAPQTAPSNSPSLAGKWTAARSEQEAFALQLTRDGRYALVHVKDGKQTRSSGNYSLSGNQLTLSGSDGVKVIGTIRITSEQQFTFAPQGATSSPLKFERAG